MTTYVSGNPVPVVPGAPRVGAEMKCNACGATNTIRLLVVTGTEENSVCLDYGACTDRYRMGMTPKAYQQFLKAQVELVLAR